MRVLFSRNQYSDEISVEMISMNYYLGWCADRSLYITSLRVFLISIVITIGYWLSNSKSNTQDSWWIRMREMKLSRLAGLSLRKGKRRIRENVQRSHSTALIHSSLLHKGSFTLSYSEWWNRLEKKKEKPIKETL